MHVGFLETCHAEVVVALLTVHNLTGALPRLVGVKLLAALAAVDFI